MNTFQFESGELITFQWPVFNALQFNDIVIACFNYDYYQENDQNVFAFNKKGDIAWKIKQIPMQFARNPYVMIRYEQNGNAGLVNSSGSVIIVDPSTGEVMGKDWTK